MVRRLFLATVVGALVAGSIAAPAHAAPPVPKPKVALPVALDLAAGYEAQTTCDPTPKPGAVALRDLLVATYGAATVHLGRTCTSSTSEHFDGRAVDWMRSVRIPAQKAQAEAFVSWLLAPAADGTPQAMARRLGVMYVIWNNRMIRMYDPGRGWTNYRNCKAASRSGKALDTTCHRNHVHLSMSWDGAAAQTSFWSGAAQTLPPCRARTSGADPGAGTARVVDPARVKGLVTVPANLILDTARGAGAGLSGGCRLRSGRALFPTARVAGVVPPRADGVLLRVTSTSNAPTRLAVWSSGGTRPTGQLVTPIGTTTATVLVPVASDGTVALGTAMGAARVTAAVVGYVGDAAGAPQVATRPSVPRSVKVRSAKRSVTTRWKAPRTDGGAAITGYRVEALASAKKGARVIGSCTASAGKRRCTISGLTKGTRYWMSVSVGNEVGRTWAKRVKVRVR